MIELTVSREWGFPSIHLSGRMDSMTSSEVQKALDDQIGAGERRIIADLEHIAYISSAGLRIFMSTQMKLKNAGGELIFFNPSENAKEVFNLSGFMNFFTIVSSLEELQALGKGSEQTEAIQCKEMDGVSYQFLPRKASKGLWVEIGSQEKLSHSEFSNADIVSLPAKQLRFGTGIATVGERYDDYKTFFGEAVVINHHLFFYPAVKRPAVDFMLCPHPQNSPLEYKFLHGFGIQGDFSGILSFETSAAFLDLAQLCRHLFSFTSAKLLGVVILAESKGLWGMNLRQVPLKENHPEGGQSIFDTGNFQSWMNFPVEPSDSQNIVVAAGLATNDIASLPPSVQTVLGKDHAFHFHAGIFEKQPITKNIEQFETELDRIATQLEITKVQHLLGQSAFNRGLIGIIELES